METKGNEQKVALETPEEDGLQNKEEGNQPNVAPVSEIKRGESPASDNVAPPSFAVNQWHQFPYFQLNPNGHPHPPLHQTASPFWPPHPSGYYLPGMNAPAIYHPLTTMDANWQIPTATVDGTSSKNHTQTPNFSYQVYYPYPGITVPWDPMSCGGHVQQSQPPLPYTLPGAYGSFSSQLSAMHGCSASGGQPSQRGTIRSSAKLSQKHQQLWEAQSVENGQLWAAVSKLQSELADHKNRLKKLETEVSSLKQAPETPNPHVTGISVPTRASKRGRPRKSITSDDTLHSLGTQLQTRGGEPAQSKFQREGRLIFEKVVLNKAENKENNCMPTITAQQGVGKSVPATVSNVMMPSLHNQYTEEMASAQMCEFGLNSTTGMKNHDCKTDDPNDGYIRLSQQANGMTSTNAHTSCLGPRNNGSFRWSSSLTSTETGKKLLNGSSQSFCDNDNVPGNDGMIIPEWSFANEDDASEQLEDALPASKDENEEIGDNLSSDCEETGHAKVLNVW